MITKDQARKAHERLFEQALEIIRAKRVDYANSEDPFANFRMSSFWGIEPWRGAGIRLMDKLSRFKQLAQKGGVGAVKDESIIDTVVDSINYVVIMLLLLLEALGREDLVKKLAGEE